MITFVIGLNTHVLQELELCGDERGRTVIHAVACSLKLSPLVTGAIRSLPRAHVIAPSQQLIDVTTLTKYHLLYCLQDVKLYSLFHNGTQHRSVWLAVNKQVGLVCAMSSCYMH